MNKRIALAFLLLLGAMFTFDRRDNGSSLRAVAQEKSLPATRPSITPGCSFIDPLDICIQTRFTQTNRGFGVERVSVPLHAPISSWRYVPQDHTILLFAPENDQEKAAMAEIERSGLKMALYLASRKVLGNSPDEYQDQRWGRLHAPIRGPVALTRNAQKADWPEDLSLWQQAQKVMQNFDSDKSMSHYEFSAGDKDFIARPVRTQEACLRCHTPQAYWGAGSNKSVTRQLSVGDPIGVLLYAYTKSTKSNNIKKP
jgi:hypothetical protein